MHPTFETPLVRLSQSQLWNFQQAFYQREGIDAWAGKIPFFPTSNVFIAHAYADLVLRFMQDWSKQHSDDNEPFYLLELGGGTGRFAYYLLHQMTELRDQLGLSNLSFVYILSDISDKNIAYWREHPALGRFVDEGLLGFAHFKAGAGDHLAIELRGITESHIINRQDPSHRPLIVVANYLLDSLPCDLFRIVGGELQEGLTRPKIKPNSNTEMNLGAPMSEAGFNFSFRSTTQPYYQDEHYDAILAGYKTALRDAYVLLPIGALDCVRQLLELSSAGLLLLATDKAFGRHHEQFLRHEPDIVLHDQAFSLTVNFHAIGEYARLRGGDCYHQSTQGHITTSVFSFGCRLASLPEFRNACRQNIDLLGPSHLLNVFTNFERVKASCTGDELISYLNLMQWDPDVVGDCIELLLAWVAELPTTLLTDVVEGLERCASLFYSIPSTPALLTNIGMFYQAIGQFADALSYYQSSVACSGKLATTSFNAGICNYFLQHYDAALDAFREAQELHYPDPIVVKGWIVECQEVLKATRHASTKGD